MVSCNLQNNLQSYDTKRSPDQPEDSYSVRDLYFHMSLQLSPNHHLWQIHNNIIQSQQTSTLLHHKLLKDDSMAATLTSWSWCWYVSHVSVAVYECFSHLLHQTLLPLPLPLHFPHHHPLHFLFDRQNSLPTEIGKQQPHNNCHIRRKTQNITVNYSKTSL